MLQRYEEAGLEAGSALRTIRQQRLYRASHETFEDYVKARWTFGLRRAQQLMKASETREALQQAGASVLPVREAQTRPLTGLTASDQAAAWARACETAAPPEAVSQARVKEAVAHVTGRAQKRPGHDRNESKGGGAAPAEPPRAPRRPGEKPWPREARAALRGVPAAHRAELAEVVAQIAARAGLPVTQALVREAVEGFNAAVVEDGLGTQAMLVGAAAGLVPGVTERAALCEGSSLVAGRLFAGRAAASPIMSDLDVLGDGHKMLESEQEGAFESEQEGVPGSERQREATEAPDARKRNTVFLGAAERQPLLVSLPRALAPAELVRALPEDVKEVIVELGELERSSPYAAGGVLDVKAVREAAREAKVTKRLTRTNEHVDWARYTANPLTGCWHGCRSVYCYASGIAQRLFAQGFIPTLYPARLNAFAGTRLPDVSALPEAEAWRERSVFVVSMGDLFGSWVPAWFIECVLDEVRRNPGWFAFLLTKHPQRLSDFSFPPNCAVGLTLTGDETQGAQQARLYQKYASWLGQAKGAAFTWISLEPFRGDVGDLAAFFSAGVQMLAMGGQSKTIYGPAMQPQVAWVEAVREQVRRAGAALFEKENLTVRPKEIPFPTGMPFHVNR